MLPEFGVPNLMKKIIFSHACTLGNSKIFQHSSALANKLQNLNNIENTASLHGKIVAWVNDIPENTFFYGYSPENT